MMHLERPEGFMFHHSSGLGRLAVARMSLGVLVVSMTAYVPAVALAESGTVTLRGALTLAVKGCGQRQGKALTELRLADDGTWSVELISSTLGGTYVATDATGRTLSLDFDPTSLVGLSSVVAEDVTDMCRAPAQVTAPVKDVLQLVFNRKHTKATLSMRYRFTATAGGKSRNVTEKIAARGRWRPA
jgi:hypothetical protein